MARRNSRNPVSFRAIPILEGIERLVLEVERASRSGSIQDQVDGFQLRLGIAFRNIQHLSHLLGRNRHQNISDGLQEMMTYLGQMRQENSDGNAYASQRTEGINMHYFVPLQAGCGGPGCHPDLSSIGCAQYAIKTLLINVEMY